MKKITPSKPKNDPTKPDACKSLRRAKELWTNPERLKPKTKEIKFNKSLQLSSDSKHSSPPLRRKLCKATAQGPRVILSHFTDVRGVNFGELVATTHFNSLEVAVMLEIFSCLARRNSNPKKMTQYLESTVVRQFLIDTFDITDDTALFHMVGTIANGKLQTSPVDFVKSFSVILRGDIREKAKFVFRTYDEDKNGYLTKVVEFMHHMTDIFDVNVAADNPTADPDQPVRDTIEYLLKKFDKNKRGEISFDDFFEIIQEEPLLMECCFSVFPSSEVLNTFQTVFLYQAVTPRFASVTE